MFFPVCYRAGWRSFQKARRRRRQFYFLVFAILVFILAAFFKLVAPSPILLLCRAVTLFEARERILL